MAKKILVAYVTKHSQSQKIAEKMSSLIASRGFQVHAVNVEREIVSLKRYDGIILGGPIYLGHYPRKLQKWVKENASILTQKHSAFFSVCLGILQNEPEVQFEERKFVESFFRQTNWYPQIWTIFAGAISNSKYNWPIKLIMKVIARMAGHKIVMSKDYEYTNWDEVNQFVERFLVEMMSETEFRNSCPLEVISEELFPKTAGVVNEK